MTKHCIDSSPTSNLKCVISSLKLLIIVIALFIQNEITVAFPTSPGSCNTGKAVSGSHTTTSSGFIEEGGYEITINGAALSASKQLNLYPYMSHSWEIRMKGFGTNAIGPELGFLGALFRLSNSNNVDISDIITLDEASQFEAKILDRSTFPLCPLGTVAVGHTSASEKEVISGTFFIEDEIDDLKLEITLVAANGDAGNRWYYSEYGITVSFPTLSPAPSTTTYPPSNEPTLQPSSGGPCFRQNQLRHDLIFKYRMDEDINEKKYMTGELIYTGQAWISIGITSEDGEFHVPGSQSVIGVPNGLDEVVLPGIYSMTSASVRSINLLADQYQTLFNHSIHQDLTGTTLTFSKYLDEQGHIPVRSDRPMNLFYAVGTSNDLIMHKFQGDFLMDLSKGCEKNKALTVGKSISNGNIWRIHGELAAMAWAVATPMAILVSFYRHIWTNERTFLKVKLYFSVVTLCLTIMAVIMAIRNFVNMGREHFTKAHHIIGIILLILTFVLVAIRMLCLYDSNTTVNYSKANSRFEAALKFISILTVPLSMYQMFSGMKLNSELYSGWDGTKIYTAWLSILFIIIICRICKTGIARSTSTSYNTVRLENNLQLS